MISMTYHLLSNLTSGQSRLTWLAYIPNNVVLLKEYTFHLEFHSHSHHCVAIGDRSITAE